jgi:hypothetical protein
MDDLLPGDIIFEENPDHLVLLVIGNDLEVLDKPFLF